MKAAVAPGVQVDRTRKTRVPELFEGHGGTYYLYYLLHSATPRVEHDRQMEIDFPEDDLTTFEIIQALEQSGHFSYLDAPEEDLYTLEDGRPLDQG